MPKSDPRIDPKEQHLLDPETGEFSPSLLELEEYLAMKYNYLNADGSENPDPVPLAPPIGYVKKPSLVETIRAMVREHAVAQLLAGQDAETFEEADDFDVADDFDPKSPWEAEFEPVGKIRDELEQKYAPKPPAAEPPPAPAEQPPKAAPADKSAPPKP